MAKQQGGSNANWKAMLKKWSLDQGTHLPAPSPEWRGLAKKWFMVHPQVPGYGLANRLKDIACNFTIPESSSSSEDGDGDAHGHGYGLHGDGDGHGLQGDGDDDEYNEDEDEAYDEDEVDEGLLDELIEYIESGSIDVPKELHSTGHLSFFIHYTLFKKHANIRAKAAEVITAMVQNNPTVQQLVMEVNGLQPLLYNITSDPDITSRTKALGAISALIRNNKPGITAFRLDDGYAKLRDALSTETTESVMFQREALNLIQYLLHENSLEDCDIVIELGLPNIMMHLAASSDDAEVREAARRGLLFFTRVEEEEGGNSGKLVKKK